MLLEKENRDVTHSGVMEVARATIKATPKIFNFFSDQTYANKPKAICRELAANAVDSHVMAGKSDTPIEVWLPTLLDPVFRVRDHGLGMSHEFMMTSFMAYADGSTKDNSNVAIGGFGIGSKSPFAYVDQYTITSKFDGTISVYSVFKDEDGVPAIGLLGQRATDEPNGVEVSFPVSQDDFTTFETAAFSALRYFEPLPDIKNAVEGSFELADYATKGNGWAMRPQSGELAVIMGGVRYPVNDSSLSYKFPQDSPARKLLGYGLDLRLPIGTCSVALSREALSYDDRTIEAIRVACEDVIDEVAESFSTMFDHIDSPWDARVELYNEVGPSRYGERAKFLADHAKWKGEPFDIKMDYPKLATRTSTWGETEGKPYQTYGYDVWDIERTSRRGKASGIGAAKFEVPDKYGVTPGAVACLIIDDLPQSPKHKAIRKIKEYTSGISGKVMVFRPNDFDGVTAEQIIEALGSPEVVLTSSLPELFMERKPSNKNLNRPRVRMFTYDGGNLGNSWRIESADRYINPGQYGKTCVKEIAYADQPDNGILVELDKFRFPDTLRQIVKQGFIHWHELHFVNGGDVKKLKKANWTGWLEEHQRRVKDALARHPGIATRLALANSGELHDLFDFFRRNSDRDFTSRKPLGMIFRLYKEHIETLDDEQRRLAPHVAAKLPARIKPAELLAAFETKQPRAKRLLELLPNYRVLDDEDFKLLTENL